VDVSNSIDIDEKLESVKVDMIELHRKISSSASIELLQSMKQTMDTKCSRAEENLEEFKSSFIIQVNERIDHDLCNLKTWFGDLEVLVKQRQTKLEQLISSCAKEYNVASLQERMESDVAALAKKASFLHDVVNAQGRAFVAWQKKMSIFILRRVYSEHRTKDLKRSLQSWRRVTASAIKSKATQRSQKSLLKIVIARMILHRKQCGLVRWIQFRDQHRKVERRKVNASTLIRDVLVSCITTTKVTSFNHWRRMVIMNKVMKNSSAAAASSSNNSYSMCEIVDSFNNDLQGAARIIAYEIQQIKTSELPAIRQEWTERSERMSSAINENIKEAIGRVDNTSRMASKATNERIDGCVNELVGVHTGLQEHSSDIKRNAESVERLRESHGKELEEASARQTKLEERLLLLEKRAHTSDEQLSSLRNEHEQSKASIKRLHEIIDKNEERHEYERKTLQAVMNHFGDELLKAKVTLGHTQVRCEALEKECSKTKSELDVFRRAVQSENEHIYRHIYHPGIKRPCLKRIVMVGNSYERLAKEKNYVTGINVTTTMNTMTTSSLHIVEGDGSTGRHAHKEEIDLPSEIAAFAHDYSSWISFQTDHESLTRMILGSAQDDQVYAEDDMCARRKSLIEEVKIELGTELEHVTYPGGRVAGTTTTSIEELSTTRGLGLRWEARAIFLARVVDAINAALSKHDQILLPAATALGRVRPLSANVTVCMACDRPLKN
jgi:hypothetical protein